jgi:hypothetical protein
MSKKDDELIAQFDKTDSAEDLRNYAKHWGGIAKADEDWFYFGNGEKIASRPLSLGERWALDAARGPSYTVLNR